MFRFRASVTLIAELAALFAATGVGWACLSPQPPVQTCYYRVGFTACATNDPTKTVDPGFGRDVGWSQSTLVDSDHDGANETVSVALFNAYPGYTVKVRTVVANFGYLPVQIGSVVVSTSPAVSVTYPGLVGTILAPSRQVAATATVAVLSSATARQHYSFSAKIMFTPSGHAGT